VEGELALALIVSSLVLEASFFMISIASDLRYHLWSMAATPLALILLAQRLRTTRSGWGIAAVLLLSVVGTGAVARMTRPNAPSSYPAMVHGSTD
jgi:hypothetical protein